MRKEEIRELIIDVILLAAALIVGLTVLSKANQEYSVPMNPFLFCIICVVIAFLVNVVGHELLHALGAKIGGYKVVSMNILGLCFEYKAKKPLRFSDFNGITGETKIAPTEKEKKSLKPYVWCPLFGYAIEVATCITLITSLKENPEGNAQWLIIASILFILISSMIAFYELFPLRLDSMNDGYRLRLLSNPINIEAYNEMLVIEDKLRNEEVIESIKVYEEITEYTASCNIYAIYFYLGKGEYGKAEEVVNILLNHQKVLGMQGYNRLLTQKLYIDILTKPLEEAKAIYKEIADTDIRRFIANDISMPSIRAYILIAGMIEESQGEIKYAISKISKAKRKSLPSEVKVEEKLVENAIEVVYKNHPKWEKETAATK